MIISAFFYVASFFIYLLGLVFKGINFLIPDNFTNAITYFLSYFDYFREYIAVDTLFFAVGTYLTALGFLQLVKLGVWIWGLIPFFGKQTDLPTIDIHDNLLLQDRRQQMLITSGRKYLPRKRKMIK